MTEPATHPTQPIREKAAIQSRRVHAIVAPLLQLLLSNYVTWIDADTGVALFDLLLENALLLYGAIAGAWSLARPDGATLKVAKLPEPPTKLRAFVMLLPFFGLGCPASATVAPAVDDFEGRHPIIARYEAAASSFIREIEVAEPWGDAVVGLANEGDAWSQSRLVVAVAVEAYIESGRNQRSAIERALSEGTSVAVLRKEIEELETIVAQIRTQVAIGGSRPNAE